MSNVLPSNLSAAKPQQYREAFENLENSLHAAGMSMANLVRTWFFLDDILSWYGQFNTVRSEFYRERGTFNGLVPASTGIGGRNAAGAALAVGAWAVKAAAGSVACHVTSPMQCPALEYGSAFNRALLLAGSGSRRLLISGTASIGPNGRSAHSDNLTKQIAYTMEVVQAILTSRGFGFSDVTRATAYFKEIQDAPVFDQWWAEHNLRSVPLVTTQGTICRRELLFEIELDAISITPDQSGR